MKMIYMTSPNSATSYVHPRSYRSPRIGDLERQAACEELSNQFAAGRLTNDELDERLAAAVGARTAAELRWVVADLPPIDQPTLSNARPTPGPRGASPQNTGWRAWDILVLLVLLGCMGVAGLAFLALLLGGGLAFMVASTLSAIVAGTGGAAAVHLIHRSLDRQQARDDAGPISRY